MFWRRIRKAEEDAEEKEEEDRVMIRLDKA